MIKRLNEIRLKGVRQHPVVYLGVMLPMFLFSYFQFLTEANNRNFFAWILFNFLNLYTIVGVIPIFYLVTINLKLSFSLNNPFYLSRIRSRRDLWRSDLQTIFKVTLSYLGTILIVCFSMGLLTWRFTNRWDQYLIEFMRKSFQCSPVTSISPFLQVVLAIIY